MSSGSSWVIVMRPGFRRVHTGSLGSLGCVLRVWGALGSLVSSGVAEVIRVRSVFRPVHPRSLGLLGCAIMFIRFMECRWVHWGAQWSSSGISWVA